MIYAILNSNPLDLIEADVITAPVIESRRPRRLMCSDLLDHLPPAAIPQISSNAGRSERVIPNLRMNPSRLYPFADHSAGTPTQAARAHGMMMAAPVILRPSRSR